MTEQPAQPGGPRRRRTTRPRASHSLETVLATAVELLDEAGPQGLTIRALAQRMGGGAASVYWYVSGREELLDLAADSVLGGVLDDVAGVGGPDPLADLRAIAVALFDAIVARPWLGAYALRDTGRQPNAMRLYERIGEQVMRLDLTPRQCFHGTSAVVGFVIGTAADMGQERPPAAPEETGRDAGLSEAAEAWRSLDAAEYPFLHHILDEFERHDDREQFRAGLDLLLAGLRLQAGG